MSDGIGILNLLALFLYLAVFGYLFKLCLFRVVRLALAEDADGASGGKLLSPANRGNLLMTLLSFLLVLVPLVLLIAVPGTLRFLLGS